MNGLHSQISSLIATLGTEPQVVTAALDILTQQGEKIEQVRVLNTDQPGKIALAVKNLGQEFAVYQTYHHIDFAFVPILDENQQTIADVNTPEEIQAAFRVLYNQVHKAKQSGRKVHLLIAGGRKTLAIYGMVTAQLLLDEEDCLWHLFSEGDFLQSRRMHPGQGDKVSLVSIPLVHWTSLSPIMFDLSEITNPFVALQTQQALRLKQKFEKSVDFAENTLSPAEKKVVGLLVREGLTDYELADRLNNSIKTVGTHLEHVREKACVHWNLEKVSRTQLTSLMGYYYASIPEEENQEKS